MDSKKKFKLADKNKPGIDRTVAKLLAIFKCDRSALQKEIDGLQEQKNTTIKEQDYEAAANLRDRERTALGIMSEISSFDTISEVYDLLEDCIFFEYAPKDVMDLCKVLIDIRPMGKMPKDLTTYERKLMSASGLAKIIVEYTPYKFFFMGGAMAEHRTLFAKDHKEAWNKANEYCVESFGGNILGIFCLTKDGEDVGTLRNLGAMFEPITEGPNEVRGVRAIDLIPNYQDHK